MKKFVILLCTIPMLANAQLVSHASMNRLGSSAPIISVTPPTMDFPSVIAGPASSAQTASYAFNNLTVNDGAIANIAAPFEGSIDGGSTWAHSFSGLSSSTGSLLIRVGAATPVGTYGPTTVTLTSTGATPQSFTLTATVSAAPSGSASPPSITGLNGTQGIPGTAQTVTLTFNGTTFTANAPTNTEISKDGGSSYASSQSSSTGSPLALKIRTTFGAPAGPISGTLGITFTNGVSAINIPVSGTVTAAGSSSDTARFAMSLTQRTVPSGFVSFYGDPSTGIRTAQNTAGTIFISTVSTNNWGPVSGGSANDAYGKTGSTIAEFPDNILQAQMYTYSGSGAYSDSASLGLSKPQYAITGLSPSATYTIKATACLDNTRFGLTCANKLRVMGIGTTATVSSTTVNENGNTSALWTITGVQPDATGKINVYVFTEPGQELAVMSGLIIYKN